MRSIVDAGMRAQRHGHVVPTPAGFGKKCHRDPTLALDAAEMKWFRDIGGKNVAVLGSGDNQVVFALSGLEAKVTSVDISEQQLNVARHRASELDLHVNFVRADVVDLSALQDKTYDVVYTGGHVAVWVSDLRRYYGEATRVLRPEGRLIVSEYHPFRRVWNRSAGHLVVGFNYFDRGPHRSEVAPDVLYPTPGELEQFEFHWTIAFLWVSAYPRRGIWRYQRELGGRASGWPSRCASSGWPPKPLGLDQLDTSGLSWVQGHTQLPPSLGCVLIKPDPISASIQNDRIPVPQRTDAMGQTLHFALQEKQQPFSRDDVSLSLSCQPSWVA